MFKTIMTAVLVTEAIDLICDAKQYASRKMKEAKERKANEKPAEPVRIEPDSVMFIDKHGNLVVGKIFAENATEYIVDTTDNELVTVAKHKLFKRV